MNRAPRTGRDYILEGKVLFNYISSWFSDPRNTLLFFLLALPGRLLAISLHEFAHAWVANRCGDPTARMLGRLTINPLKHLDLLGTLMMLLLGYGWAKPVPVNPRNFRNLRRDDLKVSLAGVTMNFLMFLLGCLMLFAIIAVVLLQMPVIGAAATALPEGGFRAVQNGTTLLYVPEGGQYYYMTLEMVLRNAPYIGDVLIGPILGTVPGYLYDMLGYFVLTNLSLAIFNLLPLPPLDGYHVFNDLFLRRSNLFAQARTAQICQGVLLVLVFTGVLGEGLGWLAGQIITGTGNLAAMALQGMGLV